MKKILCAFALALACLVGPLPSAQAQSGACVSHSEYRHVHKGMSKRRVHRVFDTRGRRVAFFRRGRYTVEIRRYRGCPRGSAVSVGYGNRRLRSKSAHW